MRLKVKLKLEKIPSNNLAIETSRQLNRLLGVNHKWHDLQNKPYTCSLIRGGVFDGDNIIFKNSAFIYINTEDKEVVNSMFENNSSIEFEIQDVKIFKDYNIFSVYNVIYNKSSDRLHVTDDNKDLFIEFVKNKYMVDIEILKIENTTVPYKKNSRLPVSNLLILCKGDKNIANLLESGIGGSCSIGFGFVEPINKK